MKTKTTRPDMASYFRGRIDWHTNGLMSGHNPPPPRNVRTVAGDVVDSVIRVIMEDGTVHVYDGGGFSARKVHGCFPPRMPKYRGIE